MGDFNIPRGARSLRHLTQGLTHAFDAAGLGYVATFPRRQASAPGAEGSPVARLWISWAYRTGLPLLHIDHAFVARWLRVRRYEAPDGGAGSHHWQLVELEARAGATDRARGAR
ncbi:hypothetical protein J4558_19280 [Leptolyngbya sp. 15MV]|nr:hypothetical protein J4558_19280 [Leptolyngbya sp. 15MV]